MHVTCFRAALWIGLLGAGIVACDGDGGTSTGTTTTTTGNGGTATTTSTGEGGSGASTSTAAGGSGGSTTSTAAGGSGGSTTSSTTTPTGPTYGFCAQPCTMVADCCAPGDPDCPGPSYPSNPECKAGACFPPQCAAKEDCSSLNPKLDCLSISGTKSCGFACAMDSDCNAPLTCIGSDDDGKKYCLSMGGGCTDDASCGGYGKCVDKACKCLADADCTAAGYGKCAL